MPFTSTKNPKTKLTASQVGLIKTALNKGVAPSALAVEYNVSRSAITRIKRNQTWRDI